MANCIGRDPSTRTAIYQIADKELDAVRNWAEKMVTRGEDNELTCTDPLAALLGWVGWVDWEKLRALLGGEKQAEVSSE